MTRLATALFALLGMLAACGGKSALNAEDDAVIGGGANGGGAGTASAAGGAPSTVCPSAAPAVGSACNYVGNDCNYEVSHCSSRTVICRGGVWVENDPVSGASYTCANFRDGDLGVPQDGASCDCLGTLDCTINQCDSVGQVHAVCDNTSWHVTTRPCVDTTCGPSEGIRCKTGEVCKAPSSLGAPYTCVPDPCAEQSETTSCACAGSLCASYEVCSVTDGLLSCACASCK